MALSIQKKSHLNLPIVIVGARIARPLYPALCVWIKTDARTTTTLSSLYAIAMATMCDRIDIYSVIKQKRREAYA